MSQFNAPPSMPGSMMRPHRGTLILVLGILGFCVCVICGICAWVMGSADLKAMDRGEMDPAGRGMTQAGKIVGMVATILVSVVIAIYAVIIVVALVAGGAAAAGSHP